jgi:signal peptidase I
MINGHPVINQPYVKYDYKICFKQGVDYLSLLQTLHIPNNEDWYERKQRCKEMSLTQEQKQALLSNVNVIEHSEEKVNPARQMIIPYKGMDFLLDTSNFEIYKNVITHHEGDTIIMKNGQYFKNNVLITHYTFRRNYYFMMGDNRDYSTDSRLWGLLPEELIIGKATFVVCPVKQFKWSRILRVLH